MELRDMATLGVDVQMVAYTMHIDIGNQQSTVLVAAGYGIDCRGAEFKSQ
jgi:hypothetical protein